MKSQMHLQPNWRLHPKRHPLCQYLNEAHTLLPMRCLGTLPISVQCHHFPWEVPHFLLVEPVAHPHLLLQQVRHHLASIPWIAL